MEFLYLSRYAGRNQPLPQYSLRQTTARAGRLRSIHLQLHTKILLGLLLGIGAGIVAARLGWSEEVSTYIRPVGHAFLRLISLYQGVSAIFIAQVYGMDLSVGQQLTVVLTATLASIGTAGAPAAGIMMLAIILRSIGVPLEGIALIFGVERILDMCRTVVNVTGDACCAVVVSATEKGRL
jgi:Na+/H+-dicarboxylate symporter